LTDGWTEPLEKDVNIWEESVEGKITWNDKTTGENEAKVIHSASLNKLVQHLTSEANPSMHSSAFQDDWPSTHPAVFSSADMTFLKIFLMTYTTFTTSEKLLNKLIERYVPFPPPLQTG